MKLKYSEIKELLENNDRDNLEIALASSHTLDLKEIQQYCEELSNVSYYDESKTIDIIENAIEAGIPVEDCTEKFIGIYTSSTELEDYARQYIDDNLAENSFTENYSEFINWKELAEYLLSDYSESNGYYYGY